jgi:hypothetical protein
MVQSLAQSAAQSNGDDRTRAILRPAADSNAMATFASTIRRNLNLRLIVVFLPGRGARIP